MRDLTKYIIQKEAMEKEAVLGSVLRGAYRGGKALLSKTNSGRKWLFSGGAAPHAKDSQSWGNYFKAQLDPRNAVHTVRANIANPLGAIQNQMGMKTDRVKKMYQDMARYAGPENKNYVDYTKDRISELRNVDSMATSGFNKAFGLASLSSPVMAAKDSLEKYRSGEIGALEGIGNVVGETALVGGGSPLHGLMASTLVSAATSPRHAPRINGGGKRRVAENLGEAASPYMPEMPGYRPA